MNVEFGISLSPIRTYYELLKPGINDTARAVGTIKPNIQRKDEISQISDLLNPKNF